MAQGVLRSTCRVCERPTDEVGRLSARGKCASCGNERLERNHRDLVAHRGPFFDHWLARTRAAFGLVQVDDDRDAA